MLKPLSYILHMSPINYNFSKPNVTGSADVRGREASAISERGWQASSLSWMEPVPPYWPVGGGGGGEQHCSSNGGKLTESSENWKVKVAILDGPQQY